METSETLHRLEQVDFHHSDLNTDIMTSVDLGMFGLDCFVSDKSASSLDSDLCIAEFESLLGDNSNQNILDISLEQSGITENNSMSNMNNISSMEVSDADLTLSSSKSDHGNLITNPCCVFYVRNVITIPYPQRILQIQDLTPPPQPQV